MSKKKTSFYPDGNRKNKIVNFNTAKAKLNKDKGNNVVMPPGMIPASQTGERDMTIDLDNEHLEGLVGLYLTEKSPANLNNIVNCMINSRFLVPAAIDPNTKSPAVLMVKNNEGELFIPVFTSKEKIRLDPAPAGVMNMPYKAISNIINEGKANIGGFVINMSTDNLTIKKELVMRVKDLMEKAQAAGPELVDGGTTMSGNAGQAGQEPSQVKVDIRSIKILDMDDEGTIHASADGREVKLSPEQYTAYERLMFERNFVPGKLFSNGKELIDELCSRREEYVDELYEESYAVKRMYPYLPEDFKVMALGVSEDTDVVSIELQKQDMSPGCAERVYLVRNKESGEAHYFNILRKSKDETEIIEVMEDGTAKSRGINAVEGVEMRKILEMCGMEENGIQE